MYGNDSKTPSAQSSLEQHPRAFYEIFSDEQDYKIIAKLLQEEFVEAKDLEDASGLSRSAALNRADKLVEKGLVNRAIKPGTENRHKPPYRFSISPDLKLRLAAFLQETGAEQQAQPKQEEIEERGQQLQLKNFQLSLTDEEPQQRVFSNEIVKEELGNSVEVSVETNGNLRQGPITEEVKAAEPTLEATNELEEESQSLEKRVGIILTQMAREIAALRNRVAYLEQKLQQKAQDTDSFDFGQVLSILEAKQNGKGTA